MISRKGPSKPSISQFTLNQADLMAEDLQRNQSITSKTQITYEYATKLLTSKAQQNNEYQMLDEPKLSHRESRGGVDFLKRKVTSTYIENPKNQTNENEVRIKHNADSQVNKRVQGIESIINQMRHHVEEIDKRASQQNRKIQNEIDGMKSHFKDGFYKMTSQIKQKFTSVDGFIEALRNEVEIMKDGGVAHSFHNVPLVGSVKLKEREVEKEIVYGLDVKSSIDGLRYHHTSKDNSQLDEMKTQISILRDQINKQDKGKYKDQYDKLRNEFQSLSVILSSRTQQKVKQCERILKDHDQNIQKINLQFQKVINEQISPRIIGIEESLRMIPETVARCEALKKVIEECNAVKNELQEKLKRSSVIATKKATGGQNDAIKRMEGLEMGETYFLDEEHYLMDSRASYILGEDGSRIKIQESQIYFLNLHNINIMNIQ